MEGSEGGYLRLIDFVSLNSRLESHKEETRWSFFSTAASERRGGNLKDFKDFYLQAKARIWPSLSFVPCSLDSVSRLFNAGSEAGSYCRLIDFESLNSRLESNQEEE